MSSIRSSDLEGKEKLLEFRREKVNGRKERDKVKFGIMREKKID